MDDQLQVEFTPHGRTPGEIWKDMLELAKEAALSMEAGTAPISLSDPEHGVVVILPKTPVDSAQRHLRRMLEDSEADRAAVAEMCLRAGCTPEEVQGDLAGVPGLLDLVQMLNRKWEQRCAALRAQIP